MTPDQWSKAHREELIRDIGKLVACPSVSKQEAESLYGSGVDSAMKTAADIAEAYGFSVIPNNHVLRVVCKQPDMPGGKEVGIWAHMDVVEPGAGWMRDPWHMEVRDGFLLGRGVKDNKGPAMAVLHALRYIQEEHIKFPYGLSLYLGASEENGMGDIEAYRREGGRFPDFSIVADGRWPVAFGEKGQILAELENSVSDDSGILGIEAGSADNVVCGEACAWLNTGLEQVPDGISQDRQGERICLKARGISRHAAFPEGGINAFEVLADALSQIPGQNRRDRSQFLLSGRIAGEYDGKTLGIACADEDSGPLTCVVTRAHMDAAHVLRICVNIRYPVTYEEDEIIGRLQEGSRTQGLSCRILHSSRPVKVDKNHPLINALMDGYRKVTGRDEAPFVLSGGTYAGRLPQAVSFGMGGWNEAGLSELTGTGRGGAHGPDEAVLIENLLAGMEIYIEALARLGKTELEP